MITIQKYVRAASLEEAWQLNQNKRNRILGGMLWLRLGKGSVNTAIDLCDLGLDKIEETEEEFSIGAMATLRDLEIHEGLNTYSNHAVANAVKDIVGVQFRNMATVGGSIWGRFGFSDVLTVFMALDTTVVCYADGEIPLQEFAKMPYNRDILVKLIVKKVPVKVAYVAQRHAKTDFPILACAVSFLNGRWNAVLGARPGKAALVADTEKMVSEAATAEEATAFGKYAAEQLVYNTNMRGSAEYRKQITPVLVKRAMLAAGKEC